MNLGTTIIGVIMILIVLIPIYILNLSQKREKKKQLQKLIDLGKNEGLVITEYDQWTDYFIGLDRNAFKLIYLEQNPKLVEKKMVIDLRLIKSAEKIVSSTCAKTKEKGSLFLQKAGLKLTPNQASLQECSLEFFNANKNAMPDNELALIDKWKVIIDSTLVGSTVN